MRAFDRDLIRGGHYGQRSCEPHSKAVHMGAPTNAAYVKKVLANSEPSTHGGIATVAHSGGVFGGKWPTSNIARSSSVSVVSRLEITSLFGAFRSKPRQRASDRASRQLILARRSAPGSFDQKIFQNVRALARLQWTAATQTSFLVELPTGDSIRRRPTRAARARVYSRTSDCASKHARRRTRRACLGQISPLL